MQRVSKGEGDEEEEGEPESSLGSCCPLLCVAATKRDRLVNNLQNLSVSDRMRMLRAMPLSVAEKKELR